VELGERQAELNHELGKVIASACDIAIVVNKVNREAISSGIAEGGFDTQNLIEADSFAEASARLATMLRAGDVVLYENDLPDSFK
jgi:UDP-N-acetylmuramoyl-tripeptide--D-alanyl-D-alanine ligase